MPLARGHGLEWLRPVGNLEQWCTARHGQGCLHNVGVSCTYRTENPYLIKNRIYSALEAVIRQHPILSVIPMEDTLGTLRFVRLPHIDLERVVKRVFREGIFPENRYNGIGSDRELDDLLETKLSIPFTINNNPLPFWRLYLLSSLIDHKEVVVTFIYHHGLADGMSGAIFHESFQAALRADWNAVESSNVCSPVTPLLPNLELIHELPKVRQPWFDLKAGLWSGEIMQSPIIGRFRTTVFQRFASTRFVQLCRARRTTVTAAMQAILAVSLFRSISNQYTVLRSLTQVNLRPFLSRPVDQHTMGVFIDQVDEIYHREDMPSFAWSDAQAARETMLNYLDAKGKYLSAAFLEGEPDLNEVMISLLGQKRNYSFDVSNLGFIGSKLQVASQRSDWTNGRMVFSRSASVSSAALGCTAITGADGCLVLGYNWQVRIVDDRLVEGVMKSVEDQILKLVERDLG